MTDLFAELERAKAPLVLVLLFFVVPRSVRYRMFFMGAGAEMGGVMYETLCV